MGDVYQILEKKKAEMKLSEKCFLYVENIDHIERSLYRLPSNMQFLCLSFQMVWEQGSVVIVMLTRLTENGEAMCYRYWPEEGSDLYHIYEVSTFSFCFHECFNQPLICLRNKL